MAGSAPKFVERLKDVEVKEKNNLNLTVKYDGDPTSVKWLRNGSELSSSQRVQIKFDKNTSSLQVATIAVKTSGVFKCVIENTHGKDESSCNVVVTEKKRKVPQFNFSPDIPKESPVCVGPPGKQLPIDSRGTLTIDKQVVDVDAAQLIKRKVLGSGAYGIVEEMLHQPTNTIMAVKRIPQTVNNIEQKRLLMDVDVNMRTGTCPYTVKFYGALFREGDVWICMEVMDTSLDKFYKLVYHNSTNPEKIPEDILGKIAFAAISALRYLQSELKVIHRDVKPSNMLVNRNGDVKICDFGISGHLVDSVAKTIDAGCKPYMAPERINPEDGNKSYDIRSDVWSLGISMIELATGQFPYATWSTPFEQLKQVVKEPSPSLSPAEFSPEFVDYINRSLQKNHKERPNYDQLLQHTFITKYSEVDVGEFVRRILDTYGESETQTPS